MEFYFYIWRPHFHFEPKEMEPENLASSGEEWGKEFTTLPRFFVYCGL